MKTVADFKRRIKPGIKLHCTFHQATTGQKDEAGKLRLFDENKGVRTVNIVKSTQFTLLTERKDGQIVDSWINFPKATQCRIINDNTIQYLEYDFRDYNSKNLIPLLTYTFVE
jgi:hypothetical protein